MSFEIQISHAFPDASIELSVCTSSKILGLFGPSGCGKTSCLNMIAGLLKPDQGEIEIGGDRLYSSTQAIDIIVEHRDIGYVFQDKRLFPHLSVRDNLLFGAARTNTAIANLDLLSSQLEIAPLLDRKPRDLSGGEAQRVAIGRALLSNPKILLLDEPMAGLDGARRDQILALLRQIYADHDLHIVMVSHDRTDLETLGAHIVEI